LKNVDRFCPPVIGNVTQRMRSDCSMWRKVDQIDRVIHNSGTDNHMILKMGTCIGRTKLNE